MWKDMHNAITPMVVGGINLRASAGLLLVVVVMGYKIVAIAAAALVKVLNFVFR